MATTLCLWSPQVSTRETQPLRTRWVSRGFITGHVRDGDHGSARRFWANPAACFWPRRQLQPCSSWCHLVLHSSDHWPPLSGCCTTPAPARRHAFFRPYLKTACFWTLYIYGIIPHIFYDCFYAQHHVWKIHPQCIHVHHYNVTYTTSDLSILLQWIRTFCYFKQCWYEYASASISVYIYKCFSWLYKFRVRTVGSSTRFFQSG